MRIERTEGWGRISYDTARDEFLAEVLPGMAPVPEAPIGVGWLVIGACDKACIQCYGNVEELPKKSLTTDQCLEVVKRLGEANVLRVVISGGEPTLRKDVFVIIRALTDLGISTILGTNGAYVSPQNVRSLLSCTRVEISVDAPAQELNDRIRPSRHTGSSWRDAWTAIDLCIAEGARVRVLTALNSLNENCIGDMARVLAERGVYDWAISWTIPAGRARRKYEDLRPRGPAIAEQVERARQAHPDLNIRYSSRIVTYDRFYFLILPDGQVATQHLHGTKEAFGSALEQPIRDFWNTKNFNLEAHFSKWIGGRINELSPVLTGHSA